MRKVALILISCFILFAAPLSASALSLDWKKFYAQNNIIFPEDCDTSIISSTSSTSSLILTPSSAEGAHGLSAERVQFVETYHDIAVTHSINYGIPWETVMAQGIVESASGTSQIARDKNNLFGIGAYDSCPYECAYSFPTIAEGWEGYYKNIVTTSTYREHGVFQGDTVTDPMAYLVAIKAAGYATDSEYVSTIGDIVSRISALAKDRAWKSSAELAAEHPEWLANAEKNRQGASVSSPLASGSSFSPSTQKIGCPTRASGTAATSNGVTTTTYNGATIAFPIPMATKANKNTISDIPCPDSTGCHYGPGVPAGLEAAAFDICLDGNCDNQSVVSMTDGTITDVRYTRNGVDCNTVYIKSSIDNTVFGYYHLSRDDSIQTGATVRAGDVIGHISPGVNPCNDSSTPHVHIDKGRDPSATSGPARDDRDVALIAMMNAAWEALPENEAELSARAAASASGELKSGGMTLAEAEAFMSAYAAEASKEQTGTIIFEGATVLDAGCSHGTLNNCSAFTQWFLNRYTTLGSSGANIWQGSQAVSNYVNAGQLTYGGKVPKPYAVMSEGPFSGSAEGFPNHTGIVLGIDTSSDQIIIGEAACSYSFPPHAAAYSLSEFTNNPSAYGPTYAYTDSVLKLKN